VVGPGAPPAFEVGPFQPVFDPSVGEDRRWYVNDHTFFRDAGGAWHLVGITHPEPMAPFEEVDLVHATAPALLGPWTRHPPALSADPAAGERLLWAPHVVEHDGRWWLFVGAGGDDPTAFRLHLATSPDGWAWTRHEANPIVVDGYEARDPMVRWVDGRWVLLYTATLDPAGGPHVVVAAESDDLVRWSGRHVVYQDEMAGTGAGPTESPFAFERDGWHFLLIGPDWEGLVRSHAETGRYDPAAYRRTRVLASRDPMRFDLGGHVATIDAHAAEVVVDGDDWWVSHCGWGQGGVHLARLTWEV
jgi:hypothetical protein